MNMWPADSKAPARACDRHPLKRGAATWLAAGLIATWTWPAACGENARLANARATYRSSLAKIETDTADKIETWPARYLQALKELQEQYRKEGDIEGWQAVEQEIKRFQSDRTVNRNTLVTEPAGLRVLQESWVDVVAIYTLQKSQDIMALTRKYTEYLGGLQKELTIAGQIEDALAVNKEMKEVQDNPVVLAAEFAIAEWEARKAAQTPSPPASTPPMEAPEKTKPVPSEIRVYEDTRQVPPLPGGKMERLALRPPKLSSHLRNLQVTAVVVSIPKTEEQNARFRRAAIRSKEIRTQHSVRMTLRLPTGAPLLTNVTVAVQGFAISAQEEEGRRLPQLVGTKQVSVPRLGDTIVTLDFPPMITTQHIVEARRVWFLDAERRSGLTFGGIIVSVFDAGGRLIYQGCSDPSLNEFGLTRPVP